MRPGLQFVALVPGAPVRRIDDDTFSRCDIDPALWLAPARKNEGVNVFTFDHGEFELAVEGGGCDRLPHRTTLGAMAKATLIYVMRAGGNIGNRRQAF
jgi:hypothetical protein